MDTTLRRIRSLDPVRDDAEICRLSLCYHFAEEYPLALRFALLRTFCVPEIARLLDQTGEMARAPQKRHDDTVLLLAEIIEHGLHSGRAQRAMARINAIHARYAIPNDQYLYVLSVFVLEPIRWVERWGWRPLEPVERTATFNLWRRVGVQMKIRDIPKSLEALEAFNRRFEAERFGPSPAGRRLADMAARTAASWFPASLRTVVPEVMRALLDAPAREALGWPPAGPAVQLGTEQALRMAARLKARLPRRRRPALITERRSRSYPSGYRIEALGPSDVP